LGKKKGKGGAGKGGDPVDRLRKAELEAKRRDEEKKEEQRRLDKRKAIAGDERVGLDFPLDVLNARGLISDDMKYEGLRFAVLAWWLYGSPPGCEALYERMVAGVGEEFGLRVEGETSERQLARILSNKARFERMVAALGGVKRGEVQVRRVAGRTVLYRMPIFLARKKSVLEAVERATQMLMLPKAVMPNQEPADYEEMARLLKGLAALVELRKAEDRHWRRKHTASARGVQDLSTPA